jgi:hypothetical protein
MASLMVSAAVAISAVGNLLTLGSFGIVADCIALCWMNRHSRAPTKKCRLLKWEKGLQEAVRCGGRCAKKSTEPEVF